jgi:putative inorganic carbon (hco3(-)) transporter
MAIPLTLLYIVLSMLSPADLFPELAVIRPMLMLTGLAMVVSSISVLVDFRTLLLPHLPAALCMYGMVMASRVLNGWVGGGYDALLLFAVPFFSFLLIVVSAGSVAKIRWVMAALLFVCLYYAVRCILAVDFGVDLYTFTMEQTRGVDPFTGEALRFRRAKGLGYLDDPNDLSQFYLATLPFLWAVWRKGSYIRNLLVVLVPSCVVLYALYLTHSRGALVGLFVLFAFLMRRHLGMGGPILSAAFTVLLVVLTGYGGGREVSATSDSGGSRLELWSDSLGLFKSSPIWGIGYGTITSHLPLTSHNSFVLALAETGAVGAFIWLALLVITLVNLRKLAAMAKQGHADEPVVRLASAMLLTFAGWVATAWFLSVTYTVTLFILLGLGAAVWKEGQRRFPELESIRLPQILGYTSTAMVGCYLVVYILIRMRWGG